MEQIWQKMKEGYSNPKNTLLDIGSGFGKMIFLVALKDNIVSHGIEVVPYRVNYTQKLLDTLL